MRIQTFKNKKGLIAGTDSKRIGCDKGGVLKIGTSEITITPGNESVMPILFGGSNGIYKATFTDDRGEVYELDKVTIKGGRITPPNQTAVELMELRHRADELEAKCEALQEKVLQLENLFDTNSLNFLIK
jgi:hypothetical protein